MRGVPAERVVLYLTHVTQLIGSTAMYFGSKNS